MGDQLQIADRTFASRLFLGTGKFPSDDAMRPAIDVWTVQRKPVDILGRMMFRLDFQLKGWNTTIHHMMCPTVEKADEECARLNHDLAVMLDGPFRSKYKIAHDLRGGL